MKPYAAYLFDADGTLLDTTELIYRCFVYTCGRFRGPSLSREQVIGNIGLTLRRQMEVYFGPLDDARFAEMAGAHMEYQLSIYREHLTTFPGIRETLERLKARGAKLAVVTSRRLESLTLFLGETGIAGFFDRLVTPESTARSKPDPQPVAAALAGLGNIDARDALVIGDSVFDIQSGAAAGADTAFVLWSRNDPGSLPVRPTWLIAGMNELLDR